MQHRRLAYADDGQVFAARGGWLTPRIDLVPHARTQSVRVTQGPWQRALRLASVEVDSTPGPVVPAALYRDMQDARAIAEVQAERARAARSSATPDRWLAPPAPAPAPPPSPLPGVDQADLASDADRPADTRPVAYPAEDVLPDER